MDGEMNTEMRIKNDIVERYANYPVSVAWIENIVDGQDVKDINEWAAYHQILCDPEREVYGSSSEFHNVAASFARENLEYWAFDIVACGLKMYPLDPDLLADALKYGSVSRRAEKCKSYYDKISTTPKERWGWRLFVFTIDYLKDSLQWTEDQGLYEATYQKALDLSIEFQETLKNEERGYVAESEVHMLKANEEAAKDALYRGIQSVCVAPQCCLKYGDLLLKEGKYEEAIKIASLGVRATAQDQPTSNTPYFFYLSALAEDAIIHQEAIENPDNEGMGFKNAKRINSALQNYAIAKALFGRTRPGYTMNIQTRESILKAVCNISE
jgi:hypothetical protein